MDQHPVAWVHPSLLQTAQTTQHTLGSGSTPSWNALKSRLRVLKQQFSHVSVLGRNHQEALT